VLSVDRLGRAALPLRFRRRFGVSGLRSSDLLSPAEVFIQGFRRPVSGPFYRRWPARLVSQWRDLTGYFHGREGKGQVVIYNQSLSDLVDIADGSIDAVVAVSALEHNTPEGLESVVQEILRVLKPGGALIATLTAGRDHDWWHAPSSGWCYTDASLRKLFDLPPGTPSNYDQYDELFEQLRNCSELRDNLASFYYRSDAKGMPQGLWDPQYQPVGVYKLKKA
jgi:SAM-dependent methyltransferase